MTYRCAKPIEHGLGLGIVEKLTPGDLREDDLNDVNEILGSIERWIGRNVR
jgi:hypothetical protein